MSTTCLKKTPDFKDHIYLVFYLFFRTIFLENFNFYFMKTANISVHEDIAVYIKYCTVFLKIDYTLRCLD